jgi:hypothetical protein
MHHMKIPASAHVLGVFALVAATTSLLAQRSDPTEPPQDSEYVEVEGRTHPELIPEHVRWRAGFGALEMESTTGERRERYMLGLSKHELYLPIDEVRFVVEVAERVQRRERESLRRLKEALPATADDAYPAEMYRAQDDEVRRIVIDGKAELEQRLPAISLKKVRRWIDKNVIPGGTFSVHKSELPEGRIPR